MRVVTHSDAVRKLDTARAPPHEHLNMMLVHVAHTGKSVELAVGPATRCEIS